MYYSKALWPTLLLLWTTVALFAQKAPIKFGKIDPSELSMTDCDFEPGAAALVLCDYGEGGFFYQNGDGFAYRLLHHKRVKIFTKKGLDEANVSVVYYAGKSGDYEKVRLVKAACYYLENGEMKTAELSPKKEGFTTVLERGFQELKFAIPGAREGCIVEYIYERSSLDIRNLHDWYFQGDLPVLQSVYQLRVPDFFIFQYLLRGNRQLDENLAKQVNQNYYGDESDANGLTQRFNFGATAQQYHWAMNRLPSLRPEPFTTAPQEYAAHIECQLMRIEYPNGSIQEIVPSYEKFGSQLLLHDNFGKIAEPGNFEKKLVGEVAGNLPDQRAKANAILQHLQEKVKWNGLPGIYADMSASRLYEKGTGDAATLNLTLVACLRAAGLTADPVILGTRNHGRPHTVYPNEGKFNFVVAAVDVDGQTLLADATSNGLPWGYLSENCLNGEGYRVSARAPGWIPIQAKAGGVQSVLLKLTAEGNLWKGRVTFKNTGYSAANVLEQVNDAGQSAYLQSVLTPLADWNPGEESFTRQTEGDFLSVVECSVSQEIEDAELIYFKPVLAQELLEHPFPQETRTWPLDFPYTTNINYVITLTLPEGYEVLETPKDLLVAYGDKDLTFQYRCASAGRMVSVVSKLQMKRLAFEAGEYADLRKFYDLMVQKNQEMLVLKKSK